MDTTPDKWRSEFHYLHAKNIITKARDNGEPVFVLRARDMHSVPALREYMDQLDKFTPPGEAMDDLYDSMVELVTDFIDWQKEHGTKHPDL